MLIFRVLVCIFALNFISTISAFKRKPPTDWIEDQPSTFAPLAQFNATSSAESWFIRTENSYLRVSNISGIGLTVLQEFPINEINTKLKYAISPKRFERDSKLLNRWYRRINHLGPVHNWTEHSHGENEHHHDHDEHEREHGHHGERMDHHEHDRHHDDFHSKHRSEMRLSKFYLRHAQCRSCVGNNEAFIASPLGVSLPRPYAPFRVMKWCSKTYPRLSCEQSPLESGAPLADFEGYCIEATQSCPADAIDMNILDTSTCHADQAASKLSCALCVNDGYIWKTTTRAQRRMDDYDGECWDQAQLAVTMMMFDPNMLMHSELNECPAFSFRGPPHHAHDDDDDSVEMYFPFSFGTLWTVFLVLICVLACARCHRSRLARKRRQNQMTVHVAVPNVPITNISPSAPSAPYQPPEMYPGQAAQQPHAEPLLAPLPQMYTPAYPVVQHPQSAYPQYYRM